MNLTGVSSFPDLNQIRKQEIDHILDQRLEMAHEAPLVKFPEGLRDRLFKLLWDKDPAATSLVESLSAALQFRSQTIFRIEQLTRELDDERGKLKGHGNAVMSLADAITTLFDRGNAWETSSEI